MKWHQIRAITSGKFQRMPVKEDRTGKIDIILIDLLKHQIARHNVMITNATALSYYNFAHLLKRVLILSFPYAPRCACPTKKPVYAESICHKLCQNKYGWPNSHTQQRLKQVTAPAPVITASNGTALIPISAI